MKSNFILKKTEKVWGYTIPSLNKTGMVKTAFSTRIGMVNKGDRRSTLNFCHNMDVYPDEIAFCGQVHGDKVVIAHDTSAEDADGIMTNRQKIALVTFYADCVPLYFFDTKNRAIALSHAGWKGTVAHIGVNTLHAMNSVYGTNPRDCIVAIGPSIGKCCFEVDPPVARKFDRAFEFASDILEHRDNGKYHIDLAEANARDLEGQGILRRNIYKSNICTSCNTHILYSYRKERGTPKRMAAVIMLT